MNTEEEVPTRVTRGALRRRSIDQDATPQNPLGSGTGAAGGTPKKATSTKKATTLGAIQEAQGRPSTPVGGGRTTRRRMSESSDTPTTAPNKAVQILKEAETGTGSGRRSRNNSLTLTEENVELLNQANEGTGAGGRTRTPARLRASHEALTNTTPQTAPPAVRRSTRRNSVTSDDGSIQSLPITTPKTPVVRSLKEETIIEEDASSVDRSEPETTTTRNNRRQGGTPKAASESPRRNPSSPLLSAKKEMTPTRVSVSPRLPNTTPRSKNVSFSDDSKQEDHQSGYPKTPTSPGKKFVLVEVNDLRNTQLINGTPKVNAEIDLNESAEKDKAKKDVPQGSPTISVEGETTESDPPKAAEVVKEQDEAEQKAIPASPKAVKMDSTPAKDGTPMKPAESIPAGDRSVVGDANNISGIEELESSMALPSSNKPKYWSNSVRGTATQPIDLFTVSKQEEDSPKREEEQKSTKTPDKLGAPKEDERPIEEQNEEDEEGEEEEEEDEEQDKNELIDDEAMEVDGYQSGDSLDAEVRREMEENEIADHGEDLGSEDTADEGAADDQYENDSFIVSDDNEELDEDALLDGTGDDLSLSTGGSPVKSAKKATVTPSRRRIIQMGDDSDSEQEDKLLSTPPSSDRNRSLDVKRSAKRLQTTDEEASPEKKPNRQSLPKDENAGDQKVGTPKKLPTEKSEDAKDTPKKIESTPTKALPSPAEADVAKGGTPKQSNSTPGKLQSSQETVTPAKSEAESAQPDTSPSMADVSASPNTTTESSLNEHNSVSVVVSRKSLPAGSAENRLVSDSKSETRKSLPASTKMQFTEEATAEDLHPSSSNLEASYQEEEGEEKEEQEQNDKAAEQSHVSEKAVDQERTAEKSAISITSDEEYFETSEVIDLEEADKEQPVEREQPEEEKSEDTKEQQQPSPEVVVPPVKPARKSLPAAPLISAQFYLGASKKEKRNTLAGVPTTVGATSTPNAKKPDSAKNANVSSKLVANPFAMASAKKAKGRLSMDDAAQSMPKTKVRNRNSLPTKLDGGVLPDGANSSTKEKPAAELDEPEPMEVDEYIEEEVEKEGQNDDGEGEAEPEPEEKTTKTPVAKPKTPRKPKKALEDFDLESILTRCNEVVRADKERKKQLGKLAQQKRDEKRRLRALREQQEKEAAATNGDKPTEKGQPSDSEDEAMDDKRPNEATTTSNNDTTGQSIGAGGQQQDEPAKKKKKRKPKVKNYVLEEIKELKKDHVSEALLRKMEAREARKQRKKAKRAAQIKQLNKENGHAVVGGGSSSDAGAGIGAKLQKVAAKKKQKQMKEEAAAKEAAAKEQPAVRVAVSAFSVFQQLQNNPGEALVNGQKKSHHAGELPEVKKGLEKDQKPVESVKKLKEANQPKAPKTDEATGLKKIGKPEKPSKENRQPVAVDVVAKTPTADDVVSAKKIKLAVAQKAASESKLQEQQQEATNSFEEVKGKQAMTKKVTSAVLLPKSLPDPVHEETRKVKKSKKNKADKLSAAEEVKEDVQQFVEEKKEVSIEQQDVPKPVPKEKKLKKKAQAVMLETAEDRNVSLKEKKSKKKAAAMIPEVAEEPLKKEVLEPIGKEKKIKKKSAMKHDEVNGETLMASAIREVHAAIESSKKSKKAAQKKKHVEVEEQQHQKDDGMLPPEEPASGPPKKRKREPLDGSTPRPTKLRALQRADHGGFEEATVTPDKTRLKRNFGFEELQATPKAVGFKVSSLLPTDDLRTLAEETTKAGKLQSSKKKGAVVAEPNRSLPLPVWTRSGYFLEIPEENNKAADDERPKKATEADAGYISLKGHENIKLKTLRNGSGGGVVSASSSASVVKPHRIDPATVAPSVISFKRQQLLEKTAHLREKKGGRKK